DADSRVLQRLNLIQSCSQPHDSLAVNVAFSVDVASRQDECEFCSQASLRHQYSDSLRDLRFARKHEPYCRRGHANFEPIGIQNSWDTQFELLPSPIRVSPGFPISDLRFIHPVDYWVRE